MIGAVRGWLPWPVIFVCQALACAQSGPQLPCGREAVPQYPDLSNAPIVTFWSQSSLGPDWKPPSCTGWTAEGFSTLVTAVARFRGPSTEDLLRRIGAISFGTRSGLRRNRCGSHAVLVGGLERSLGTAAHRHRASSQE